MPDLQGKLSQPEIDKALAWIRGHMNGNIICAVCKTNNWTLGDHTVAPPTWGGAPIIGVGTAYPQVMLSCNKCSHTIYFGAVSIGLYPPLGG
jgi:hypothetical protein